MRETSRPFLYLFLGLLGLLTACGQNGKSTSITIPEPTFDIKARVPTFVPSYGEPKISTPSVIPPSLSAATPTPPPVPVISVMPTLKGKDLRGERAQISNQMSSGSLSDWRRQAQGGSLYCPFPDQCIPSLAMISIVTSEGVELCSGFLLDKNRVVTNDHCVNKATILKGWETRFTNLPCNGFIYVHFSAIPGDQNPNPTNYTYACSTIELRSGENGISSPDYAIIHLQSEVKDRAPQKLAQNGFQDKEKVKIVRVQMGSYGTNGGLDGSQSTLDCEATYGTFLYPALNYPQSTLMTFGNCPVQGGNSGSPILNSKGEAGAIVQGYITPRDDKRVANELVMSSLDGSYGEVAIGSQLPCIRSLNASYSQNCSTPSTQSSPYASDFLKQFSSFEEESLPKVDLSLEWRSPTDSSQLERTFIAAPRCSDASFFESPVMVYKKGLNRMMKPEWRAQTSYGERKATLQSSGNIVSIGGFAQGYHFSEQTLGSILVPVCTVNVLGKN